ncbi:MAG: hypothetical protein M3P18_04525 [Actinomycetota bacterium]|nr:hypothetical protein [Actinomycetota bacterium]
MSEPLEPDEIQLTTGERVRFRLLVKPSQWNPGNAEATVQSSRPLRWARLESGSATRLAHLESVLLDLRYALRCCRLLVADASSRIRLDADIAGALWRATLVSYRRCFTTGARGKASLPAEDETREWHEAFIALANGHIAHPIDRFEDFHTFALGRPEDDPPQVVGLHVLGISHQLGAPAELLNLHKLLQRVEKATALELASLREAVMKEARAQDAGTLFSVSSHRVEPMSRIGGPSKTTRRRGTRRG